MEKGSAREDLVLLGGMPTVTPPMWTTLATGAYPVTHGITAFFNQHPDKLDTVIYNLDSRMCHAEPLWNVFAETGKNTLFPCFSAISSSKLIIRWKASFTIFGSSDGER